MRDSYTKTIGNGSYIITQLPAMRALRLKAKLIKLLGPSASVIFAAASKDILKADEAIPQALTLLVDRLDENTFDKFVLEMLQGIKKDGRDIDEKSFDSLFTGQLNELFLVLKEVLEANFGDFFQEGGILKILLGKEEINEMPHDLKKH